jgi:hypothetical protein
MLILEIKGINFIIYIILLRQFFTPIQVCGIPGIFKISKNYNPLRCRKVDGMGIMALLFQLHPHFSLLH